MCIQMCGRLLEKHHVVSFVGIANNPTSMMTKPVSLHKLKHCLDLIGVYDLN